MTPEKLGKILNDTEELDPWLLTNFFQPLISLQEATKVRYQVTAPPQRYWEARDFAVALWECSSDDDMHALVSTSPEVAAQLGYLLSVFVLERQLSRPERSQGIEPTATKPFAALASRALEWLDEVEVKSPGKTQPPE